MITYFIDTRRPLAGPASRRLEAPLALEAKRLSPPVTQVGGHAGALVFMIGTLAGLAGGGWPRLARSRSRPSLGFEGALREQVEEPLAGLGPALGLSRNSWDILCFPLVDTA